jgi:hypothetical protein
MGSKKMKKGRCAEKTVEWIPAQSKSMVHQCKDQNRPAYCRPPTHSKLHTKSLSIWRLSGSRLLLSFVRLDPSISFCANSGS